MREDGVINSRVVRVAIGVNWDGRSCVLAVELARRERVRTWKEFLEGLVARGELVVSDDHSGLRKAIPELLPGVAWQRCYVRFLRNALDSLPRNADDDCLTELRWLYDRHGSDEARRDLAKWLETWTARYPKRNGSVNNFV